MTDTPTIESLTAERERVHASLVKERADHKQAKELLKQARDRLAEAQRQINEAGIIKDPKSDKVSQFIADSVKAGLATATTEQLGRIAALEAELAESRAAGDAFKQSIAAKTIEATLREAATEAKILPTAIPDVVKLGRLDAKVNEDGSVEVDGRTVADFIEGLKESSPYFWPTAKGSDAKWADGRPPGGMSNLEIGATFPGMSGNPFDATSSAWNLTKQGELLKSDPTLAAKLQAAAGQ